MSSDYLLRILQKMLFKEKVTIKEVGEVMERLNVKMAILQNKLSSLQNELEVVQSVLKELKEEE